MTIVAADHAVLELTRHFDAPPEQVFDAWLSKSWGDWAVPSGVEGEVLLLEPRVGGRYRLRMRKSDGTVLTVGGIYREIARSTKLAMTWKWEHGQDETVITLTFRASGNGTDFLLRHEGFTTQGDRDAHLRGWTGTLDKPAQAVRQAP
jgi:uncharacterized protein YndB with AHSA1/START domain